MWDYGLDFISNENLYAQVKETVLKYRFDIDLSKFNKNLIDPIKLTFDSKIYNKTIEETVEDEIIRQIDKSNTNEIWYFHQNIFRYIGIGWVVPKRWYDIVNESKEIYVEMKNKHNTMNSSSSQKTFMRMQNTLLEKTKATCYLVEVIARNSQDIKWAVSLDWESVSHNNIRRMSIDKFYELVTGKVYAFRDICSIIPSVLDDVILEIWDRSSGNTVLNELEWLSEDMLKSIYLLSFAKYEGFDSLIIK